MVRTLTTGTPGWAAQTARLTASVRGAGSPAARISSAARKLGRWATGRENGGGGGGDRQVDRGQGRVTQPSVPDVRDDPHHLEGRAVAEPEAPAEGGGAERA